MISQTAEYALRAVVFLAERPGRWTTKAIAETTHVPPGYLAKIMQSLAQAGVVSGQRGLKGGFSLVRPPHELAISEVIEVIDPIQRINKCPLDLEAHSQELCPLHARLDKALALIEESFRESTVGDLLYRPTFSGGPESPSSGAGEP